ncbi:MAG: NTP transferase domain-containing protein [candidate division WOR-3 bacterium]
MTALILAAGKSKRINLTLSQEKKRKFLSWLKSHFPNCSLPEDNFFPKVLLPLGEEPLISHIINRAKEIGSERIIVVINPEFDVVREVVVRRVTSPPLVEFVYQEKPLGTADAVKRCAEKVEKGEVLILCGDTPLLKSGTLKSLHQIFKTKGCDLVLLSAFLPNPYGYGRIVRSGSVIKIVEERDADEETKKIGEVNAGVYLFKASSLFPLLSEIQPSGYPPEYYLTDTVSLLQKKGGRIEIFTTPDPTEILGVNTEKDYELVRDLWQSGRRH